MTAWTKDDLAKMQGIIKDAPSIKLGITAAAEELGRKESAVGSRYYSLQQPKKKKRTVTPRVPSGKTYLIEIVHADGTKQEAFMPGVRSIEAREVKVLG